VTVAHACMGCRRAIKLCTLSGKTQLKRFAAELESRLSSRPRVVACDVLLKARMRGCAMSGYQSMSHEKFFLFCLRILTRGADKDASVCRTPLHKILRRARTPVTRVVTATARNV
jgi:hypothetical protein